MKRLICLAVSAAMAFCLCSFGAWAAVPAQLDAVCTQEEWQMLKLTNKERLAQGLVPYSAFAGLQAAADVREKELIQLYSHTRPDQSSCFTAITQAGLGYTSAAENIAAGQKSPEAVTAVWLDSDGHRQNMLDAKFTHTGTGYTDQPCTIVSEAGTAQIPNGWVQMFIAQDCSITSISLSQKTAFAPRDGSLDSLDLYIEAQCSAHGPCYLPVLSEMCSGFDPNADAAQAVTVSYAGHSQQLLILPDSVTPVDLSSADSWAVDWISRAHTLSLLSELNRTGFTDNVTRLQFADLAVSLAQQLTGTEITPADNRTFTDTTETAILKAKTAGIAGGYEVDGKYEFRPQNPITRQEICVILAHVVDYVDSQKGVSSDIDRTQVITASFPDAGQVADWAVKQVALMTNNSVMSGRASDHGTMLTPLAHTTLQEAVTLTVKLHDLLK
ncbi:MAG: S-layer homology domain-containing protein [Oscillospiraceae bacterium]|nr:S-layer homology domain-containing protein [Oscillospiraceae bacterium]